MNKTYSAVKRAVQCRDKVRKSLASLQDLICIDYYIHFVSKHCICSTSSWWRNCTELL